MIFDMSDKKQQIIDFIKQWIPNADRVVVLPDEPAPEVGGLISSGTGQGEDKPLTGTVMAVGEGRYSEQGTLVPMRFKVGDHVLFGRWVGSDQLIGEDLKPVKYDGIKRDEQVLVTTVRADSLEAILPS